MSASALSSSSNNKGNSLVLPQFVALKSSKHNKFLGYQRGPAFQGYVMFEYDDLWSPYVKLELVNDKKSGFISIRCCYNNRFCRRQNAKCPWIVAGEDSPISDHLSPSCTLFDFSYDTTHNTLSLRLVLCNNYPIDLFVGGSLDRSLFAGEDRGRLDSFAEFVVYDMDSMVRLPKYVVLRGDNGKYLGCQKISPGRETFKLGFDESDAGSERARHEVQWKADGNITLTSVHIAESFSSECTAFWKLNPLSNRLYVGINDSPSVFQPVKVDNHTVALRCLDNRSFCKRLDNCSDLLSASVKTIDSAARLVVEEYVISRRVYSMEYDLDAAHIYDVEPLVLASSRATNTNTGTSSLTVPISYTERSIQSWNNGFSFTGGVEMESSGGIPFIMGSKIKVKAEGSDKREWGGTLEKEKTVGSTYTAPVECGKTVVVKAIATKGKCDVKFSYIQRDTLTNGKVIKTQMHDGVFRGMNYFDFSFVSSIEEG